MTAVLVFVELIAIYVTRQLHRATREESCPIPFTIHIRGIHGSDDSFTRVQGVAKVNCRRQTRLDSVRPDLHAVGSVTSWLRLASLCTA